jgi:hypothetical protein
MRTIKILPIVLRWMIFPDFFVENKISTRDIRISLNKFSCVIKNSKYLDVEINPKIFCNDRFTWSKIGGKYR